MEKITEPKIDNLPQFEDENISQWCIWLLEKRPKLLIYQYLLFTIYNQKTELISFEKNRYLIPDETIKALDQACKPIFNEIIAKRFIACGLIGIIYNQFDAGFGSNPITMLAFSAGIISFLGYSWYKPKYELSEKNIYQIAKSLAKSLDFSEEAVDKSYTSNLEIAQMEEELKTDRVKFKETYGFDPLSNQF